MTERIEKALYEEWRKADGNEFTLNMKAGYTLTVKAVRTPAHRGADHRWHSGSTYFEVYSSKTNEKKYFRSLETMAKAMVAKYI